MTRYLTIYFSLAGIALHLLVAYLCAGAAWTHLSYRWKYGKWAWKWRESHESN